MQRHNEGFSLIELMIVMVIAAILISGTGIGLRYLSYSDSEKIAKTIEASLSKLQVETMSRGNQYTYLSLEWDGVNQGYYLGTVTSTVSLNQGNWDYTAKTVIERRKIASSDISIAYAESTDGSDQVILNDATKVLLLNFDPGSGAFKSKCQQIIISSSSEVKKLRLILLTGNHFIE